MKKIIFLSALLPTLFSCQQHATPYVPPPYSFANDSWDVINEVAKGGLSKLIETYRPHGNTFIITNEDSDTDKANKTRKVHIDGVGMFEVRVIGEEHDISKNAKTALTFEFVNLLHSVPYSLAASITNEWSTSHLRGFLNERIIKLFTPELQTAIKSVKKETLNKKSNQIEVLEEKVFPLSYSEIGGIDDESHALEGKKYRYYEVHSAVDDRKKGSSIEKSSLKRYWLRSPTVDSEVNCYYVNENGKFSLDDVCIQLNVSPAFAI